jgi:hypothetical protein
VEKGAIGNVGATFQQSERTPALGSFESAGKEGEVQMQSAKATQSDSSQSRFSRDSASAGQSTGPSKTKAAGDEEKKDDSSSTTKDKNGKS